MIIGFGSTETALESALEKTLAAYVEAEYKARGLDYFTDEFVADVKAHAKELDNETDAEYQKYKDAETYPDRYSTTRTYVVADCNHIAFIIDFHHINRRHALSPDGWASLQTKACFDVAALDMPRAA